jgi:rhodanese-related sulfurtransferase
MNKYFVITITIIMTFLFCSRIKAQTESENTVDVQKFIELQNKGYTIIDVRTPEEFSDGYIEGASNIDFHSPDFGTNIEKLDKDGNYLVYCRSGNRSLKTVRLMKSLGFKNAYSLTGGINIWLSSGNPTVK